MRRFIGMVALALTLSCARVGVSLHEGSARRVGPVGGSSMGLSLITPEVDPSLENPVGGHWVLTLDENASSIESLRRLNTLAMNKFSSRVLKNSF